MNFKLDPRTKLGMLILANLLLFLHVSTWTEAVLVVIFLFPFFLSGKKTMGVKFFITYLVLFGMDFWLIPIANGVILNIISLLSVGIRMMLPCIITGAYAFSTTTISEFVCALRKMHISEAIIIPCMVVIRFFPTIREDYLQIRNAMELRGIAVGNAALIRHPEQTLEYILIPLLMNANNVAQDLSVAALTKGIGLAGKHSSMIEIRFSVLDVCMLVVSIVPFFLFFGGIL